MIYKKLRVIKEIKEVVPVRIPVDKELHAIIDNFITEHKKTFGRVATKQQVLLLMIDKSKESIKEDIAAIKIEAKP